MSAIVIITGDYGKIESGITSQWLKDASYSFFDRWYKCTQVSLQNAGNSAALWNSNHVATGLPIGNIAKVGIAFYTSTSTDLVR